MGKKKYISDYVLKDPSSDGKSPEDWVYAGVWYRSGMTPEEKSGLLRRSAAAAAVMAVSYAALGLLNGEGMNRFYAVLPYAAGLWPLSLSMGRLIALWRLPERFTRRMRDRAVEGFARYSFLASVLGGMTAAGEAVCLASLRTVRPADALSLLAAGVYLSASLPLSRAAAVIKRRTISE